MMSPDIYSIYGIRYRYADLKIHGGTIDNEILSATKCLQLSEWAVCTDPVAAKGDVQMTIFGKFVAATLFAAMVGEASSTRAAEAYSNASLKGSYSYLVTLHTADPTTTVFADLGIATFDGAGNVSVKNSDVALGVVTKTSYSGTYTVNANGTGAISLSGGPQYAMILDSVAHGVATDVQLLRTSDTANEVVSGHAVLQSTTPITYTLKDTKGSVFNTVYVTSPISTYPQGAAIGTIVGDGKGNFTFTYKQMYNGQYMQNTVKGTETISADGTGTSTFVYGGVTINNIFVANSVGAMAVEIAIPYNLLDYAETHK